MIIANIVRQHAEEADFLWTLRGDAVRAPNAALMDLARLDARIDAHLEGLAVAGSEARELCMEALNGLSPGGAFAVAMWSLLANDPDVFARLLAGCERRPGSARGVSSALAWLPLPAAEHACAGLFADPRPAVRRIALAAGAANRRVPEEHLIAGLESAHPDLRSRSLRAVGELGRVDLLRSVRQHLDSEDPACRFWSAWSGTLLGDSYAPAVLERFAAENGLRGDSAVQLLSKARGRTPITDSLPARRAMVAAGARGDPAAVPQLLDQMCQPKLARAAGEAFTMITGCDLAREHLTGAAPPDFAAGPTENPDDPDVAVDPDERLPWPDVPRVQNWWDRNQGRFQPGTRYVAGYPVSRENMNHVLRQGKQPHRAGAALELALLARGDVLFDVRAPGLYQLALLAATA